MIAKLFTTISVIVLALIDLTIPLGFAYGNLYFIPYCIIWICDEDNSNIFHPVIFTIFIILMSIIQHFDNEYIVIPVIAWFNRVCSIIAIWFFYYLLKIKKRLNTTTDNLKRIKELTKILSPPEQIRETGVEPATACLEGKYSTN